MLVPVGSGLFMVEAQGMEQLMLDDLMENAALSSQGYSLSTTATPHKREAACARFDVHKVSLSVQGCEADAG